MSKSIHIAVASDSNYAMLVSVLLTSVFEHNKDIDYITVHLLSNCISPDALALIRKHIPQGRGEMIVHDVSNIHQRLGVDVPPTISISSYARLFLGSLLDEDIPRVIYMDVDALVLGSLWPLWTMDMTDHVVAGVLDDVSPYAKKTAGLKLTDVYINAGFLLINLDRWRSEKIERQILDYLVAHHGVVYHHDQGLINAVCRDKRVLPVNYNMVTNFYVFPYQSFTQTPFYTAEEMEEGKLHPVFIHFTAGVAGRPWMQGCKHPLDGAYREMMEKAGFDTTHIMPDNRPARLKFLASLYYHCKPLYYFILKIRSLIKER